MDWWLSCWASR